MFEVEGQTYFLQFQNGLNSFGNTIVFRDEIKFKLKETIHEFLQNDEDLENIPIDNIKQVDEIFISYIIVLRIIANVIYYLF